MFPEPFEYQIAFQNLHNFNQITNLHKGFSVYRNQYGIPHGKTGSFGTVFKMHNLLINQKYACKCFKGIERPDLMERYDRISKTLKKLQLSFMVDFEYFNAGIRVNQNWYPMLLMKWIEGTRLDTYIDMVIRDPRSSRKEMQKIAFQFLDICEKMAQHGIAHGDLQHGNILVDRDKQIHFVDYDGMYVPEMEGKECIENGLPGYQHPQRNATDYHPYLDHFSAWIIYLTLFSMSEEPTLWDLHEDKTLIFGSKDFENPSKSEKFKKFKDSNNQNIQLCGTVLKSLIYCPELSLLPPLSRHMLQSLSLPCPR